MTRVTLEILPEAYIPLSQGKPVSQDLREVIEHDELVEEAGLRAQLEIESFVTGQLLVRLDLRPDTPIVMSGIDSDHPEIPTIRSNIQEMLASIQAWLTEVREDVDIAALTERTTDALAAFAALMDSPDLHQLIAGLNAFINDRDTQALSAGLRTTLAELGGAAAEAQQLFSKADEDLDTLVTNLGPVLERLDDTLATADGMLEMVQQQVSGDSEQAYQLQAALREVEGAAAALREFFDYLERNPEALLRGRQQ
jgi:paraquat-inducible protein B